MVSRHMDPVLSPVSVRPATSEDREALGRMLSRLSARTIYERFHAPYPSVPAWALAGIAAGDVRYGSVKRVASAVGAGAIAVQSVHEYLGSTPHRAAVTTVIPGPVR